MVDEVRQGQEGISPEAIEKDIQDAINTIRTGNQRST
jgi:hypothetical protein